MREVGGPGPTPAESLQPFSTHVLDSIVDLPQALEDLASSPR
jgi:hypothetical protein